MTTTTTPEISPLAKAYREALYSYNMAAEALNTSFGGKRMSAYSHDSIESVQTSLENAKAFAAERNTQITRLNNLTFLIENLLSQGAAEELHAYEKALWASARNN